MCEYTYIYICVCVCMSVCLVSGAANKSKVLWGVPRDPDLVTALQELEEEESEMGAEDEKPKVRGGREGGREGGGGMVKLMCRV